MIRSFTFVKIFTVICCAAFAAACARSNSADENLYGLFLCDHEPNDTLASAFEVSSQNPIAGFMHNKGNIGDTDYYKVVFAQHEVSYKIMLTGVPGVDMIIRFFDSDGKQLFAADEGGIGECEKIWDYYPTEDFVYVSVSAKAFFNEKIPYYLTFTPKGENSIEEIEPNNTEATAVILSENNKKKGLIFPKNDVDYYKLTFSEEQSRIFSVIVEPLSNIDIFFTIYDKTNNITKLINSNAAGITEQIKYLDSVKGSYFIRIGGNTDRNDKRDPAYSVITQTLPEEDGQGNLLYYEQEFNDTKNLATDIPQRCSITGTIFPDNDVDWYKFDVLRSPNTVNISLSDIRGLDTVIDIFDAKDNLICTTDNNGPDGNENVSLSDLTPGRYFIRIHAKSGSSMINYTLFCNIN